MDFEDAMLWGIGATALLFIGLLAFGTPLFASLGLGLLGGVGATFYMFRRSNKPETEKRSVEVERQEQE